MVRASDLLLIIPLFLLQSCSEITVDGVLKRYNNGTVPYITIDELAKEKKLLILDTREKEEYEVSRIPGAIWVGFKEFNLDQLKSQLTESETPIVVYCSVGVRSEDIGENLIEAGYTDVRNLYGGIFEWKNKGNTVVDSTGQSTENVHAYSKYWGKLLTEANKVY